MHKHRHLSIGVTVNLEHYENLRLEVSGELDSPDEADELVAFLDQVLGTLGRGDAATAERVDSYRRRVFTYSPARVEAGVISSAVAEKKVFIPDKRETHVSTGDSPPISSSGHIGPATHQDESCRGESGIEKGSAPPLLSRTDGSTVPTSGDEESEACEACGSPVSRSEKKISELFASRILCKKCIRQG